jgi:hypothetical protein
VEPNPLDDQADLEPEPGDEAVEDLDPREAARLRRRDHDAAAHDRELMRPGMGKVFKQITDVWSKEAPPDHNRARKGARRGHGRPQ